MRPLYEIAREIRQDWVKVDKKTGAKTSAVYFGAKPYLEAMATLQNINQDYYCDSGKSVVLYFLANAQSWRGDTAKRIKAELKAMC